MGVTRWGNKKPDRFTQTNQRGIATNCKVTTKADIGLVRVTLRMNKRLARLKTFFFFFFFLAKPFSINTHKTERHKRKISKRSEKQIRKT